MNELQILHIWNTAGVGSVLAKYQARLFGWKTWVVMRKKFDKFCLTTYGEVWNVGGKIFIAKTLWIARKYDIIHVHALDRIVPLLKRLYPRSP